MEKGDRLLLKVRDLKSVCMCLCLCVEDRVIQKKESVSVSIEDRTAMSNLFRKCVFVTCERHSQSHFLFRCED